MDDQNTEQPELDKPDLSENIFHADAPRWSSYMAHFFRIGLAIFLGLSLFLSGCRAQASKEMKWQPATSIFSLEEVALIWAEHSSYNVNTVPAEWVSQTQVFEIGNLQIIDFNNPGLCGTAGCLYVGYAPNQAGEMVQVLYVRLNRHLPPSTALFAYANQEAEGLPCIDINQMTQKEIEQIQLCFNGERYVVQSKVLLNSKNKTK